MYGVQSSRVHLPPLVVPRIVLLEPEGIKGSVKVIPAKTTASIGTTVSLVRRLVVSSSGTWSQSVLPDQGNYLLGEVDRSRSIALSTRDNVASCAETAGTASSRSTSMDTVAYTQMVSHGKEAMVLNCSLQDLATRHWSVIVEIQ